MSAFQPKFLDCRDLGHSWEPVGDVVSERSEATLSFTRTLRCSRCMTERRDQYHFAQGTVQKRKAGYTYPVGYQVKGGLSRGEARVLLWMPRTTVHKSVLKRRASA